jgi:hypothetical protein
METDISKIIGIIYRKALRQLSEEQRIQIMDEAIRSQVDDSYKGDKLRLFTEAVKIQLRQNDGECE